MKAAVYDAFRGPISIREVPEPTPTPDGVVLRVMATGVCRSDWHGWQGHDADITSLPHVAGHELAGIVEDAGPLVERWSRGDRVTVPFVGGCGRCPSCLSGNQQVCDAQSQPGFTHWGSFAEYVRIDYADANLVPLPAAVDFVTAASLGCRFTTAYRAVVDQGGVRAGAWVAVHGCGGVGLSAIMIARAFGARVAAVDVALESLARAQALGAEVAIDARRGSVVDAIIAATDGGAHCSVDAVGRSETAVNSVACLRKRGRHVQVGLLVGKDGSPPLPMAKVIANELEIVGSHGMQAHRFTPLLKMIETGALDPRQLVGQVVDLHEGIEVLMTMDSEPRSGITVVDIQ